MDLARQFGVNRSTIREAIRELETHGLLGRVRGEKRLRVTRPEPRRVSSGVSRALALHDVTFLELWEAMMAIEPVAAQYAAARRTAAQLQALVRAGARFKREVADTAARRVRRRGFLHRRRRGQRQSGAGHLAGAAQSAARAGAHPHDRSRAAGARAHPAMRKARSPKRSSSGAANRHARGWRSTSAISSGATSSNRPTPRRR